jgi:mono/diheme cytochrome c family protein
MTNALRARTLLLIVPVVLAVALGGCNVKHPTANLVNGKMMFQAKCGSCHTLSHANTTASVGPNLDDAFRQDRADGIKSTSIQGLIDYWIRYPNSQGVMPANCGKPVNGAHFCMTRQEVQDVAAYVGAVAAKPGQDTGALALGPQAVAPTPANGKALFTGTPGCGGCHVLSDAGTTGTTGPNLTQRLASDCALPASQKIRGKTLQQCILTAIVKPYAYLPSGYAAGVMPNNFSQTLSKSQLQALVTYLSSVTK